MAYLPNTWVDQNVERPKTYNFTQNDDGSTSLIDAFGNVTELGTPVNADYMNHIEQGIALCAVRKYSQTETYSAGEWVQGKTNEEQGLYESLTNNNTANPLTDETKWKKVEIGGGSGMGLPMGMLVPALFPIESACMRRTDGSILMQDGELAAGVKYIKEQIALYPSLGLTEAQWQAMKEQYGEVPAFVIDDEAGTIRLPLIVNPIKGVTDLSQLGSVVEAGLPNIEAEWTAVGLSRGDYFGVINSGTGAVDTDDLNPVKIASACTLTSSYGGYHNQSFDASRSNPVYGKSDTVQPQQPTGCYYIVLATGTTEDYTALEEYAPIEVHTLLESKYSESILYNPAWLRSNGQWNAKSVYPTAYDMLLIEHNSAIEAGTTTENGYTKRGLPVKLSTEEHTDFDFVINTADETFRLPLKNGQEGMFLSGTVPVAGNGMTLGLTDGSGNYGLTTGQSYMVSPYSGNYGASAGTGYMGSRVPRDVSLGVTTEPLKSGLLADLSNATISVPDDYYLYYYVGNVTKNASVVNVGRIEEKLVDLQSKLVDLQSKPHVVETYRNGASWYRVWSDGWIEQGGDTTETQITDVTYTKPFKNRPFVTASATDGTTASTFVAITNITTSGFRTISGGWHPSGSIVGALGTVVKTWYACGY